MLKYVETAIVLAEVPDEITLAINISNCPIHCQGCHSSYLWEDTGTPLTEEELNRLLKENPDVSCVSFMGGDNDPKTINELASYVKNFRVDKVKVAWYSGQDDIDANIDLDNFDYIKIGHYSQLRGPLKESTTNQKMFRVTNGKLEDITYRFQNR